MRHTALVMVVWACLLAINTSIMGIFGDRIDQYFLLGGASAATAFIALMLFLFGRRVPNEDPDGERPVTELSVPSMWTGLGIALLAASARLGVWLALVAGGIILTGLAGIARELRFERRARRARERSEVRR